MYTLYNSNKKQQQDNKTTVSEKHDYISCSSLTFFSPPLEYTHFIRAFITSVNKQTNKQTNIAFDSNKTERLRRQKAPNKDNNHKLCDGFQTI